MTATKNGVKTVKAGFHTVTPAITVRGAAEAIEFYKKAFGAVEVSRFASQDGRSIMHAEIRIVDSPIMLSDEFPNMGCKSPASLGSSTGTLMLYIEDVDAMFHNAVAAGAKGVMPPADMFWGDRHARVIDPFGHAWGLSTPKENLTQEEVNRRGKEFLARMGEGKC